MNKVCCLLLLLSSTVIAEDDPLRLVPGTVRVGGELTVVIARDDPGQDRQLLLVSPAGIETVLEDIVLDLNGRHLYRAPLPANVTADQYLVRLTDYSQTIDEDPLTILASPEVTVDPTSAVGGQRVQVMVRNIDAGTLQLDVDGIPVVGPLAVQEGAFSSSFLVPRGGAEMLDVVATNTIGNRLIGVGSTTLNREDSEDAGAEIVTINLPSELNPRQIFDVSGEIRAPEGQEVSDFDWTFFWESDDGKRYPINYFEPSFDTSKGPGAPVSFSLKAVVPDLGTGYPLVTKSVDDKFGFAFQRPDTGQRGETGRRFIPSYNDYEGIIIKGRVTDQSNPDDNTNGLANALWNVQAKTQLIDLDSLVATTKVGNDFVITETVSASSGLNSNTQLSTSPNVSPSGCPITLGNGVTDIDGNYQFAFSPEQTEFFNALIQAMRRLARLGNFNFHAKPRENEFRVRVAGLHLNPPFGVLNSENIWSGTFYDFRREPDPMDDRRGNYFFGIAPDGPFNDRFFPGNTLETQLTELPPNAKLEITTDPAIPGVQSEKDGTSVKIGPIYVFPHLRGTSAEASLAAEETEVRLLWNQLFGELDGVLKLDGQVVSQFVVPSADYCGEDGFEYRALIPGLALYDVGRTGERIIDARIEGGAREKDFKIILRRGPDYFLDASAYESFGIDWRPEKVTIIASEPERDNDATAEDVPKDVGTLENTNAETATFFETITSDKSGQSRVQSTAPVVGGRQGESKTTRVHFYRGGTTRGLGSSNRDWYGRGDAKNFSGTPSNGLQQLINRAKTESPSLGGLEFETLFDTGKIPLFRYAWGVPPIAAATLGADFWFKLVFRYLVYVELFGNVIDLENPSSNLGAPDIPDNIDSVTDVISVSALAQPQMEAGLDLFFDLSALGGLVSAKVIAAASIGVTMPIVFIDFLLDTQSTTPCFGFVLDVIFEAALGWCPACFSVSIEERLLEYFQSPLGACTIEFSSDQKGLLAQAVPAGKIFTATDGFGSTMTITESEEGIVAGESLGLSPLGQLGGIASGPGAMRPEAVYYDVGLAVGVWAQSGLSEQQFDALQDLEYGDPSHCAEGTTCPPDGPTPAITPTVHQHLVYAMYDGSSWGPQSDLTTPSTGEGGVAMAACMAGDPGCPSAGEVIAVWEKDTAGNISQQQLVLMYAVFDGQTKTWSPAQELDPVNAGKEVQARPIYVNGSPVVFWVRNPGATATDLALEDRVLMYDFLDESAGPQMVPLPATFPSLLPSAASPDVDVFSNGDLGVVLTRSADAATGQDSFQSFFGTRRSLRLLRGTNCTGGICQWDASSPRDKSGRRIYVEQPSIAIDSLDNITISFRQLGVELAPGLDYLASDPVGVVTGTGDLAFLHLTLNDLSQGFGSPLTIDGAVNWQNAPVFDTLFGAINVVNSKGPSVAEQLGSPAFSKSVNVRQQIGNAGVLSKGLASDDRTLFMNLQPHVPDLTVAVSSTSDLIFPDTSVDVAVRLENLGVPLPAGTPIRVTAYWDGPAGVGQTAEEIPDVLLEDGVAEFDWVVPVPDSFEPDDVHRLFVTVNPMQDVREANGLNNSSVLRFNDLPPPTEISPFVDHAGTAVVLEWDPVEDDRVTGFRIYRRLGPTGEIATVGFTPTNGFIDLNTVPGQTFEYRVASTSAKLNESAPSDWLRVSVGLPQPSVFFADGFEDRGLIDPEIH